MDIVYLKDLGLSGRNGFAVSNPTNLCLAVGALIEQKLCTTIHSETLDLPEGVKGIKIGCVTLFNGELNDELMPSFKAVSLNNLFDKEFVKVIHESKMTSLMYPDKVRISNSYVRSINYALTDPLNEVVFRLLLEPFTTYEEVMKFKNSHPRFADNFLYSHLNIALPNIGWSHYSDEALKKYIEEYGCAFVALDISLAELNKIEMLAILTNVLLQTCHWDPNASSSFMGYIVGLFNRIDSGDTTPSSDEIPLEIMALSTDILN